MFAAAWFSLNEPITNDGWWPKLRGAAIKT
jgi:hypothetical protein